MHHLPLKRSSNPASGPEFSVPAIGWPGIKCTSLGSSGIIESIIPFFVDPTSVIIAPLFKAAENSFTRLFIAPTGTPNIIKSEFSTDFLISS